MCVYVCVCACVCVCVRVCPCNYHFWSKDLLRIISDVMVHIDLSISHVPRLRSYVKVDGHMMNKMQSETTDFPPVPPPVEVDETFARPQVDNMYGKCGEIWTCDFWDMWTDKQTDRQTDTLKAILRRSEVKMFLLCSGAKGLGRSRMRAF